MDKKLKVVVVEGPAGSGKTTLIKALTNTKIRDDVTYVAVPKGLSYSRRSFDSRDNGASFSLLKDMTQFLWALRHWHISPESENTIYLMDRFVLSQYVYGSIRHKRPFDEKDFLTSAEKSTDTMHTLFDNWSTRLNVGEGMYLDMTLIPVILSPNYAELNRRRAEAGKEYPYDAKTEVEFYDDIWQVLYRKGVDFGLYNPDAEYHLPELIGAIDNEFGDKGLRDGG